MKAAVVGHPIAHSQSPTIHGHWLESTGIAGTYEALDLHPDAFADEIRALVERGFQGVNVTVPHKEAALALADTTDETARRIGASNTLVFTQGKIQARNTDAYGFWENLAPSLTGQTPKRALVLGAGGAARAVLVALQDAGVQDIVLANRTLSRAQALADELAVSARIEPLSWDDAEESYGPANAAPDHQHKLPRYEGREPHHLHFGRPDAPNCGQRHRLQPLANSTASISRRSRVPDG